MATYKQSNSATFKRFFEPVSDAYPQSANRYNCKNYTDLDFCESVILRCLSNTQTGRDFLQLHSDHGRIDISTDHFFKSIISSRRLSNLSSLNELLANSMKQHCEALFASMPELDNFAIYAGDGHFHGAAAHDPKTKSSKGVITKRATGHFFMLNLRNHHLAHLTIAERGGLRKGEHDMRAIKRSEIDQLRGGEPVGRKVILAWDKAGIDFAFWQKVKHNNGLYFISREKENMKLIKSGDYCFDRNDPRNAGVSDDELVSPSSGGGMLRRVTYIDPISQIKYVYLTTEITLPPWAIVLIYKHRWDIEKVFDELKNKLMETKSWSTNEAGKQVQAQALCLTHNLMVIFEEVLRKRECIDNHAERKRKKNRKKQMEKDGGNFISSALQRFTVRSVKFIRWLRNFIYREASWGHALARLRQTYAVF